jgi:hypothetical protein
MQRHILFVKMLQTERRHYALSRVFSPFSSNRELYSALQILKRVGQAIGEVVV